MKGAKTKFWDFEKKWRSSKVFLSSRRLLKASENSLKAKKRPTQNSAKKGSIHITSSNKGLIGGTKRASDKIQIQVHFVPPPRKAHFVPVFNLVYLEKAKNRPTLHPCSSAPPYNRTLKF